MCTTLTLACNFLFTKVHTLLETGHFTQDSSSFLPGEGSCVALRFQALWRTGSGFYLHIFTVLRSTVNLY